MDLYVLKKAPMCTQMDCPICVSIYFLANIRLLPASTPLMSNRYGYGTGYDLNFGVPIFRGEGKKLFN